MHPWEQRDGKKQGIGLRKCPHFLFTSSFPLHVNRMNSNKFINPFPPSAASCFPPFSAAMWKCHCHRLFHANTIPPLIHCGAHEDKQHLVVRLHSKATFPEWLKWRFTLTAVEHPGFSHPVVMLFTWIVFAASRCFLMILTAEIGLPFALITPSLSPEILTWLLKVIHRACFELLDVGTIFFPWN